MYKLVIQIDKVINCRKNGEETKETNKSSGSGIEKCATVVLKSVFRGDKNNLNKTSNFVVNTKNKEDDKKLYETEEINGKYQKVHTKEKDKAAEKEDKEEEKEDDNEDDENVYDAEEINEKYEEVNVEEEKGKEKDDDGNVDDEEVNERYEELNKKEEIELEEIEEEIEEEILEFIEVYEIDDEVNSKAAEINVLDEEETIEVSAEIKDEKHGFSVGNSQESLSLHKNAYINNDKSNKLLRFKCNLCNKPFLDEDDVKIHKKEAHPKIKKWRNFKENVALNNDNYHCENCEVYFHDKSLYDKHTLEHEEKLAANEEMVEAKNKKLIDLTNSLPGQDILKCRICKMAFNSSGRLEEHTNYCSAGRKVKWECIICHNLFESHQLLYAHFKDHDDTTRPRHCHICRLTFDNSYLLKLHMRQHKVSRR